MTVRATSASQTIGFLTVMEDAEHGLLGGYLALNTSGRPLEFHCTAPIKANRAQEILYGRTLAPYLEGELIGGALLMRPKTPPAFVCINRPSMFAVRATCTLPVLLTLANDAIPPAATVVTATPYMEAIRSERAPPPTPSSSDRLLPFELSGKPVAVLAAYSSDRSTIEEASRAWVADFDLQEPFTRIREALEEARSAGSAASKATRQSAAA
jgi:hypothetical protein